MKAGLGPLNVSAGLQNPYCSIYVMDEDVFDNPSGQNAQSALRDAYNGSAAEAYYQYATNNPNTTANQSLEALTASGVINSDNKNDLDRRRLLQIGNLQSTLSSSTVQGIDSGRNFSLQVSAEAPATPSTPTPTQASALASSVTKPAGPNLTASNFSTPYLDGITLQAYNNVTFNFTECYSKAARLHVTVQSQQFPYSGPDLVYSIHAWIEQPFSSSATACCVFQDINDIFLNLETGGLAISPNTYIATSPQITSGGPVRNYDTQPISTLTNVVYAPLGVNNPSGDGREYSFPVINGTNYISGLEDLYYITSQVLLGDDFCSPGNPQLASAVDFIGGLLSKYAEEQGDSESPGGIPAGIEYLNATSELIGTGPPVGCLIEDGAEFDGDLLTTMQGNQTLESCCAACWFYYDSVDANVQCDVWVLDTDTQSCELRNNTLAAAMQVVDVVRDESTVNLVSGRITGIQPLNSTAIFTGM